MDTFLHVGALWVHILGIAMFVGPQFFLAFAWIPTSKLIEDLPTRARAMRKITTRFGYLGGVGIVLIVIAGSYLIATWRDWHGEDIALDAGFLDYRFGLIFVVKMSIFAVMLLIVGMHMVVVGPAQVEAFEELANGDASANSRVLRLRRVSMALSITGLLLTLAIMAMGSMLSSTAFSLDLL